MSRVHIRRISCDDPFPIGIAAREPSGAIGAVATKAGLHPIPDNGL